MCATYSGLWPKLSELRAMIPPAIRGTLLGSALGILPGGGPVLASFSAYSLEKKIAKDPSRFGRGAIEGVAGPEAANNAAAQTSFIPMLTLGIAIERDDGADDRCADDAGAACRSAIDARST